MQARTQHSRQDSSGDWTPGTVVHEFVDEAIARPKQSELPDWDQWGDFAQASGSTSPRDGAAAADHTPVSPWRVGASHNQADDDFFAALERSGAAKRQDSSTGQHSSVASSSTSRTSARPASPPMIDLRPEQRRISERDRQLKQHGIIGSSGNAREDDWFASFERNGSQSDGIASRPRPSRDNSATLAMHQLDSINEAKSSPLPPPTPQSSASEQADYFAPASTSASTNAHPSIRPKPQPHLQARPDGPSSWWGSIRHLGSDLANRAADYLDPGVDFTDEELKMARKIGAIDLNSREATPSGSRSSTPVPVREASRPPNPPSRKHTEEAGPTSSKFISGAPGVDFASLNPHWNTGSWNLSADDPSNAPTHAGRVVRSEREVSEALGVPARGSSKDGARPTLRQRHLNPLPVTLLGRYEDSSPVITSFHSSHLQPYLPPRLKLGRTWRLLYSSDQHGVSLETLYDRVKIGMDAKGDGSSLGGSRRGGGGMDDLGSRQDAWLRGASSATREALGSASYRSSPLAPSGSSSTRPARLGSGLTNISDAGLVLAVRDADDNVFGAFVNERLRKGHRGYYGSGECFLFRQVLSQSTSAETKADAIARRGRRGRSTDPSKPASALSPFEDPYIRVYPSAALNTFHALSEPGYIAFGGSSASYQSEAKSRFQRSRQKAGASSSASDASTTSAPSMKTSYGLWLDESFSQGVSGRCETYGNGPLCDSVERIGDVLSILDHEHRSAGSGHRFQPSRGNGSGSGVRGQTGGQAGGDADDDDDDDDDEMEEAEMVEGSFEPVVVEVWAVGLD
ncbi:unnamed protein product [Parajaminaea phylloscopi]